MKIYDETNRTVYTLIFYSLVTLFFSGVPYNHITGPEVLDKHEQSFGAGITIDPSLISYDTALYAFQPVLQYRTGLGHDGEFGLGLHGVVWPALTLDYKRYLVNYHRFYITGDIRFFLGYKRPTGLQYDVLIGTNRIYGVAGLNYFFTDQLVASNSPNWLLGIGASFTENEALRLQLAFSNSLALNNKPEPFEALPYYNQPNFSFGFSYVLLFRKRGK